MPDMGILIKLQTTDTLAQFAKNERRCPRPSTLHAMLGFCCFWGNPVLLK